ncbi:glycosyltransferase family 2 protein [Halalkalicoccus salilacus]|uniref:glycosyltransferase family 2 protein n=1 Tax=Halalkalicoccus salilacus TaxID=3117459 RepID=UPI00300E9D85
MRQDRTEPRNLQQTPKYTNLAIGVIADETTADATIRTVVRARNRGVPVFVLNRTKREETAEILRSLDAILIDSATVEEGDYQTTFAEAARNQDCSGIAIHKGPERVDFESSFATIREGTEYVVTTDSVESSEPQEIGLLVGIPAYNEEIGIGSTILEAQQYADEVVVIDDGSEDRTVDIARNTGATVLEHETNQGKGRAINTFLAYARSTDHHEFVVLDADGQHVPEDIPTVLEPVRTGEADVVIGSRYLEDGAGSETPRYRRVGQRVLDVLTLGSSGTNLTDTQSGFRAFSPTAIDSFTLRTDGMGVETEMIGAAVDSGLTITEVPIDVRYEGVDGQTFNPFRHGMGVAVFTLQLIRDRHPLLFFGVPGILLTGLGILLGLNTLTVYQETGQFILGWALLTSLLTIVGVLSVFCGLILNRISNMINELQGVAQ